jgi:hypothetical protein
MTIEEIYKHEAEQDALWEAFGTNCECGCNLFYMRFGHILCFDCYTAYPVGGWSLTKPTVEEHNPNIKSLEFIMDGTKFTLIRIT